MMFSGIVRFDFSTCLLIGANCRDGNPWESAEFNDMFEWLVTSIEPRGIRVRFRKLLSVTQRQTLQMFDNDRYRHNEELFGYLTTHSLESYQIFLKFLGEQPGEEYALRTVLLKKVLGLPG